MKTELGQVWKNVFGSLARIEGEEEEGQLLVRIEKGSQISFSRFLVLLEQAQDAINAPLTLNMRLREDGSVYVCVVKEIPVTEEIKNELGLSAPAEIKKRGRKKAEVEDAVPAEKGE